MHKLWLIDEMQIKTVDKDPYQNNMTNIYFFIVNLLTNLYGKRTIFNSNDSEHTLY